MNYAFLPTNRGPHGQAGKQEGNQASKQYMQTNRQTGMQAVMLAYCLLDYLLSTNRQQSACLSVNLGVVMLYMST